MCKAALEVRLEYRRQVDSWLLSNSRNDRPGAGRTALDMCTQLYRPAERIAYGVFMARRHRWQAVRIAIGLAAIVLFAGACYFHENKLSLLLASLAIIALSVIDYIDGSIWWLSDEWTDDPESPTARVVASASMVLGGFLLIVWLAVTVF
jgi:hypothetical protein